MDFLFNYELWAALVTLTTLEIILGIDNIIFISVLTNKLPTKQRQSARIVGLSVAMIARIMLLFSITWLMQLTDILFTIAGHAFSGKDLILMTGGLFLIFKAAREIHNSLEKIDVEFTSKAKYESYLAVILQIGFIDMVFSVDSVLTAIGLVDIIGVMVTAIVIAILVMMLAAGPISRFVDKNPPVKMLALAFIVLIGFVLVADGWGFHIPKGYIYFAIGFSFGVQLLNLKFSSREKVKLRKAQLGDLYYRAQQPE